ncbi:hypothetical protein C7212DRAFT_360620 [Tuber magnatum]|uniref:Uncharacterized protein n=1 Tax=Tuber magnatum TaxID=42249 RepID=A0A317SX81_9PEZI|nr:hypothetical protein C7212DRAFT_360620 [Tuber magnatum]
MQKRVNHLIAIKAFTRQSLPMPMPRATSLELVVKELLEKWEGERVGFSSIPSFILFKILLEHSRRSGGILPPITKHPAATQPFAYYHSYLGTLQIRDTRGAILGYRFKITPEKRYVRMTGGVVKDMAKAVSTDGRRQKPLGGTWHGVCLNQGLDADESRAHQDWMNDEQLFNCVAPFWDGFQGGELVLWQMGMRIGLEIGDGFFFYGSLVAHEVMKVTAGVRNSIDLFTRASNFKLLEKHKTAAGRVEYSAKANKVRGTTGQEESRMPRENAAARRQIRQEKKQRKRAVGLMKSSFLDFSHLQRTCQEDLKAECQYQGFRAGGECQEYWEALAGFYMETEVHVWCCGTECIENSKAGIEPNNPTLDDFLSHERQHVKYSNVVWGIITYPRCPEIEVPFCFHPSKRVPIFLRVVTTQDIEGDLQIIPILASV